MIHEWAKKDIGNIFKEKRILLARLDGIQKALEKGFNSFLLELNTTLQIELERILNEEEILWIEESRQTWSREGDRNTRFFLSLDVD